MVSLSLTIFFRIVKNILRVFKASFYCLAFNVEQDLPGNFIFRVSLPIGTRSQCRIFCRIHFNCADSNRIISSRFHRTNKCCRRIPVTIPCTRCNLFSAGILHGIGILTIAAIRSSQHITGSTLCIAAELHSRTPSMIDLIRSGCCTTTGSTVYIIRRCQDCQIRYQQNQNQHQ